MANDWFNEVIKTEQVNILNVYTVKAKSKALLQYFICFVLVLNKINN